MKNEANTICEMCRILRFCRASLEQEEIALTACRYLARAVVGLQTAFLKVGFEWKPSRYFKQKQAQGKKQQIWADWELMITLFDDGKTLKGTFRSTAHLAGDLVWNNSADDARSAGSSCLDS